MSIRRTTDFIAVHCSATKAFQDIGAAEIRKWHVEDNGWSDIGYNQIIRRSGAIELGRPLHLAGAHVKGYNNRSVGVCLIGGLGAAGEPEDNFTEAQYRSLQLTLDYWLAIYPNAVVKGHREFPGVSKACPCFDAIEWWNDVNRQRAA